MSQPIEILIKKSEAPEGSAPINQDGKTEQGKPSPQVMAINNALISAGKQAITNGIRQQGALTGDYTLSDSINTLTSFTADALMIAKGGPVGIIAVASKYTLAAINSSVQQTIADRNNAFIRQRTGMISTKGSRYTDD